EYVKMWIVGLVAAVVFLGGWNSLLPNLYFGDSFSLPLAEWTSGPAGSLAGFFWGAFWILLKSFFAVFVHMWIRWTYPRLRVDQLMSLCWKVLTPITLLLFVISAFWKLWEVYQVL
ncbi:MAG: NADH-quinone oxidoreductase subunit H, partial [Bacteroidota bacterium]